MARTRAEERERVPGERETDETRTDEVETGEWGADESHAAHVEEEMATVRVSNGSLAERAVPCAAEG